MSSGTAENPELIPHKAGFGTAEETCEAAESTPSPNRSWLSHLGIVNMPPIYGELGDGLLSLLLFYPHCI